MPKKTAGKIVRSSGNVFADMGLPDAVELDTKARLGAAIHLNIERNRLIGPHRRQGRLTPRSF